MPLVDPLTSVKVALEEGGIIPDVVSEEEASEFQPTVLFYVTWGEKQAMLGNELQVEDTLLEPNISLTPMGSEDEDATYTLAMLDPDAPSRDDPKYGPFRHWLVSGLKPRTESEVLAAAAASKDLLETPPDPLVVLSTRSAITAYRPPGPGPGTGTHRYVFLLFLEPPEGLKLPAGAPEFGTEKEFRRKWSGMKFAQQHGLKLVGVNYLKIVA